MKKWFCKNEHCTGRCVIENVNEWMIPCICPYISSYDPQWVEMDGTEPVAESNQLPKLTAEVFDREDCPEWANWAAVDSCGDAYFYMEKPQANSQRWNDSVRCDFYYIGKFDASDWQNSLIKRPVKETKLPEWVEIGGYVYDARNGYGKIVSGSVKSCYIEFDGGAGDFVPEAFAELKQARLRPYNADEMRALIGKVIVEKKSGDIGLVTGYCNRKESVYAGRNDFVAALLLSDYTIDGKPCGKLVHKEGNDWVE